MNLYDYLYVDLMLLQELESELCSSGCFFSFRPLWQNKDIKRYKIEKYS